MTIADKLTISRIIITPVIIGVMLVWSRDLGLWIAFSLYFLAAVTDFLDGYIARKFNQQSEFGKFWDPLADKILVCSVFVVFVEWGQIPGWGGVIIICREFLVTGLRAEAAKRQIVIPADSFGKLKTISQILLQLTIFLKVALDGSLIQNQHTSFDSVIVGIFWIVIIFTLGSAMTFLFKNRSLLFTRS